MRNSITFLGLLFIGICLVSCGPTKEDAIRYNDAITFEQTKVVDAENRLTDAVKQGTNYELDKALDKLSVQVDSSTAIVKEMEAFDGKTDMKDAALALFAAYRSVIDNEYNAWMINLQTPADEVDDQILDEEKELINAINDKLNKASDDFKRTQNNFALTYKFLLSKN